MLKIRYTLLAAFVLIGLQGISQIENDECRFATFIPDSEDFCSGQGEFTNVGSTPSAQEEPFCWLNGGNSNNDVWYSFRPKNLAAFISVSGDNQFQDGTLATPTVVIYSGSCGNLTEVGCNSVITDENRVELSVTDLIIGSTYYLRVTGLDSKTGTFKLCLSTFAPTRIPQSDCPDAVVLCSKDPFYVEQLLGTGNLSNEVSPQTCLRSEMNSVWYKWVVDKSGTLSFDLLPNNATDDLDFALYILPGGLQDCDNKSLVRCMASGDSGTDVDISRPCTGITGLGRGETDINEEPGCNNGSNNYIAEVDMVSGETYLLLVNNFSGSGFGFSIEFGGTGTFQGAEPNFDVEALELFECDKTIAFSNQSIDGPDPIVSYTWSFGAGATPATSTIDGPIDVVYESFGDKTAALTIESSRGCILTKTVDFFVEPCCSDTTQLGVNAEAFDLKCFGINEGRILAEGMFGSPEYEFRIDGGNYKPNPQFSNLAPGEYQVFIRDIKGCEEAATVEIGSPPPIEVDAGEDQLIDLGDRTSLQGVVNPPDDYTYNWIPIGGQADSSLSNYNILDPNAFPCESTTYILQAINPLDCIAEDTVSIGVSTEYIIHSANILRADSGDKFTLFGNDQAISHINELIVFDRWGNKMYQESDFAINDPTFGWDGKTNGQFVELGVYTWLANVEFLCGVTPPAFTGDITVIR